MGGCVLVLFIIVLVNLFCLGVLSAQEPDSFNCGIFALLLSRCLHHDVKISRCWSSKDLDEQRDLVVLELIEGRLVTFV